jgi:hypothetical protein
LGSLVNGVRPRQRKGAAANYGSELPTAWSGIITKLVALWLQCGACDMTPATAIQSKAVEIGRLYALGNDADRERHQRGVAATPLEAVADQAWRRANELEDSLAADVSAA